MKIQFVDRSPPGAAIVLLVRTQEGWTGTAAALDRASQGQLNSSARVTGFAAKPGEICEVIAPRGSDAPRILLVGLGSLAATDSQALERIGGQLCARLLAAGAIRVAVELADAGAEKPGDAQEILQQIAFGARLRAYSFDRYRTQPVKPSLQALHVVTSDAKALQKRFARYEALVAGVFLARDLVYEPPNVLTPKALAAQATKLSEHGVRVQVLGEKKLKQLGFGALLGVAQGSVEEPRVVIAEYDGTRGKKRQPPLVLAGKGVTFDAGGISIKPSAGLETLKQDMGGAASILGVLKTLALRRARCHVVGICGLVENMPSGSAQRPGDVVKTLSGKTVEIINTDAEGRLVLCDILWYAQQKYRPKVVIDMATLTGAIAITLGEEYAGLFSNDDGLAGELLAAGAATGDRLWRYPMGEAYNRLLESHIADMKHVGPDKGRAIIAAEFIKRFVQEGVAWAHVDFGMMVWAEQDQATCPTGATGFGVRLLDRLIAEHFEAN